MSKQSVMGGYRVAFALLTLAAIGYQFFARTEVPDFEPVNFFSFFTVQSNLFAAVVLLSVAWRGMAAGPPSSRLDLVRGAAVLYLATTGVVYGLLLAGYQEELQTTIPWVDTVLHRVMPLVMVADWLVDPPRTPIAPRRALVWLLYPLAYVVYSLIRGPIAGWYPYPFLDPDAAGGYAGVGLYCVGIAVGVAAFAWLTATVGRRVRLSFGASG